jgi:nucleotide-binding universal stress UspA family protein
MFEKLLVAHDGSKGAQKAFEVALEIAARSDAELHMISVQEKLRKAVLTFWSQDSAGTHGSTSICGAGLPET